MSSFKSIDLFGSGPHRAMVRRQGNLLVYRTDLGGNPLPGSNALGLVEVDLVIAGRLVAASESALRTLRDAVVAQLAETPTAGTLVDPTGRSWSGMTFVRYEEAEKVDRGRVWSVGYEAVFRRFRE